MLRLSLIASVLIALLLGVFSIYVSRVPGQTAPVNAAAELKVMAAETFLADIAQNVAGSRLKVEALMPIGVDIHAFEPTPSDAVRLANSNVVIISGSGLEEFLGKSVALNDRQQIIEASAGLISRTPREGEPTDADNPVDPHFWLDPNNVITYVENIREGLSQADPDGADTYAANADAYVAQLHDLDSWVAQEVAQVPPGRRLIVTNHESLGYFADRYGFTIVGTIIPSVSTEAQPSAQQLASLVQHIKSTGAPAIFLETGTNPQMAEQIAKEAGVKVVTQLYSHSVSDANGPAPTYIDMIKYDVMAIVDALK